MPSLSVGNNSDPSQVDGYSISPSNDGLDNDQYSLSNVNKKYKEVPKQKTNVNVQSKSQMSDEQYQNVCLQILDKKVKKIRSSDISTLGLKKYTQIISQINNIIPTLKTYLKADWNMTPASDSVLFYDDYKFPVPATSYQYIYWKRFQFLAYVILQKCLIGFNLSDFLLRNLTNNIADFLGTNSISQKKRIASIIGRKNNIDRSVHAVLTGEQMQPILDKFRQLLSHIYSVIKELCQRDWEELYHEKVNPSLFSRFCATKPIDDGFRKSYI